MLCKTKTTDAIIERFWSHVQKTDSCWIWIASKDKDGYGQFHPTRRKKVRPHRFSYELVKGNIAEDLYLDHLCKNKSCVNPDHLESVTPRENLMRDETPAKINTEKTHCPKGHQYSGDNLYINSNGRRECRICIKERKKKYYQKHIKQHRDYAREYQRKKRLGNSS